MHGITLMFRNRYLLLIDLLFFAISPFLSFTLRLETLPSRNYLPACLLFMMLAVSIKPVVFYFWGMYRRLWQYAGISEAISIVGAVTFSSGIIAAIVLGFIIPQGLVHSFPRSALVIDWLLTIVLTGVIRFFPRIWKQVQASRSSMIKEPSASLKRVLIVGAGEAGSRLLKEIQTTPKFKLLPVGLVDDDPAKHGMRIHNVPVLGPRSRIPEFVKMTAAEEVIIAMPTASGQVIRETVEICRKIGVPCRTIPSLYELINGTVTIRQIREIRVDDILRREPIKIDVTEVAQLLKGTRVLVTGAGGSIGSELCRQLATFQPELLVLLGHGENSIFRIYLELSRLYPSLKVFPVIADVRDRERIMRVFEKFRPTIVFHTAAHKHVPLMEQNPIEAVTNNIFGSRNVAEAAVDNGVERFVLISTDKAVNPVSFMGVSKRVAELLIQGMAKQYSAPLIGVRFGNVLGSRGSVVLVFQEQIAAGGPVTVTHPDATRFFMSIPEAVCLVLQAAAMGKGGEIFVLDMGKPVRILDLAQELVCLHGLKPGQDIQIVFTGLRPGEKLSEELFFAWEKPEQTRHPKILKVNASNPPDYEKLLRNLSELEHLVREGNIDGIIMKLREIVPEFQPSKALNDAV